MEKLDEISNSVIWRESDMENDDESSPITVKMINEFIQNLDDALVDENLIALEVNYFNENDSKPAEEEQGLGGVQLGVLLMRDVP